MNKHLQSKKNLVSCASKFFIIPIIFFLFSPMLSWGATRTATDTSSFKELLKNDKVDKILIPAGATFIGNFQISRSITILTETGLSELANILPLDPSEPTVSIEKGFFDDNLLVVLKNIKIRGLVKAGVAKKITFHNIKFIPNDGDKWAKGIKHTGLLDVECYGCTFKDLRIGVYVVDGWGEGKLKLQNCTFANTHIGVMSDNDNLFLGVQACEWNVDCYYGVILRHDFDSDVSVNIDKHSIESMNNCGTVPFKQKLEGQESNNGWELSEYGEMLTKRYCKSINTVYDAGLNENKTNFKSIMRAFSNDDKFFKKHFKREGIDSLDTFQAYIPSKFQEYSQGEITQEKISDILELYLLSAVAPLIIMEPFVESPYYFMANFSANNALNGLCDNYFVKNIFYPALMWTNGDAIPLNTANISLNIGSQNALWKISSLAIRNADDRLRDNINLYFQWLNILNGLESKSNNFINFVRSNFPDNIQFQSHCISSLQAIKNLAVIVSRITRIYLFDIPIDTVLLVGYAKTLTHSDNKDRVIFDAREIAQYYPIANKLCVTKTTNMFQDTLTAKWRELLKKDKFQELTRILGTESNVLSERKDLNSFYESWK